jgi:hypothetical protein
MDLLKLIKITPSTAASKSGITCVLKTGNTGTYSLVWVAPAEAVTALAESEVIR